MTLIESFDPRTGRARVPGVAASTGEDVDACARRSAIAFPGWAATSSKERAAALEAVAAALDSEAHDIVALADDETALGRRDTHIGTSTDRDRPMSAANPYRYG